MSATETKKADKITYKELRFLLGITAIALPFVLIIGYWIHNWLYGSGNFDIIYKGSMSAYYYTRMRDVFVGTLIAQGIFLLAYVGYPSEEDNIVGNLAGFFAILTALAPTADSGADKVPQNYIHIISAVMFFIFLAYYCLVLFRRTDQPLTNDPLPPGALMRIVNEAIRTPTFSEQDANKAKIKRNTVYTICGWVILLSLAFIFIGYLIDRFATDLDKFHYTLWLEAIATWAFGVAWFVKSGKYVMKD